MGVVDWIRDLFQRPPRGPERGRSIAELARRLGIDEARLKSLDIDYTTFKIPKRNGKFRTIDAPAPALKDTQRRILRRLLGRLRAHPCATAYERGHSIASNAKHHEGRAVVVRLDVKEFFASTKGRRVREYFEATGWSPHASDLLMRLCTKGGSLPQGAPTSPRLANLLNIRLDARLAGLAHRFGARYTRYSDDITLSFENDVAREIHACIALAGFILKEEGYRMHIKRKLSIRRRGYEQQRVTGLVVNRRVALPRTTRRWLRAVRHRIAKGERASLTPTQIAGWAALERMIAMQSQELK